MIVPPRVGGDVSPGHVQQDASLPDVLEDGDGLRVREALQREAVHRQDLVTCGRVCGQFKRCLRIGLKQKTVARAGLGSKPGIF
jgi:hypothetical protein